MLMDSHLETVDITSLGLPVKDEFTRHIAHWLLLHKVAISA